jgi:hypothetical protein
MADSREKTLSEFEQVDLEFKKMQILLFRQQLQEREDKLARLEVTRERQVADWLKGQAREQRKQASCKHRKGGRNNNFAKGDGNSYSINLNTYPTGRKIISCTRCGKEVEQPNRSLKKANPKLYADMWAEWVRWNDFPTDNSPSGGQVFTVDAA